MLQPAPASGPWQAITKVKVPSGGSYEQGGLVLFKDDKNFAKAVLMDSEGSGWVVEFGQDINGVASPDRLPLRARCRRASRTPASGCG